MKTPVIIIGWGNAARFFAHKITNAVTFEIEAIASRSIIDCKPFAHISIEEIPANFKGIVLVCVSDDAIEAVAAKITCTNATIAHCAGSVSLAVLHPFEHAAVFYPLQTLANKAEENFPVLIECQQKETESILFSLAAACHLTPALMSSADRLKLHLAAVMTNNFTNHLLASIKQYLQTHQLDAQLLMPLLTKTVSILGTHENGFDQQTGPAKRKDTSTIEKHLRMLAEDKALQQLYAFFSKAIGER